MKSELEIILRKLDDSLVFETEILTWGAPVPSFGDVSTAVLATIGLNPSNREFVNKAGCELEGAERRFHTLNSLGISSWADIDECHLEKIQETCYSYFDRNPYDTWFKKLDNIISGTAMSYYFPSGQACHLDLIPYATASKWANLTVSQKKALMELSGDTLGLLLKKSQIRLIILNGKTVVENLQKIANVSFDEIQMEEWTLARKDSVGVAGYAYKGIINQIGDVQLNRSVNVLGYNHNIQSSFGVTSRVQTSIRNWISKSAKEILS